MFRTFNRRSFLGSLGLGAAVCSMMRSRPLQASVSTVVHEILPEIREFIRLLNSAE